MTDPVAERVTQVIAASLISPNETDSNGEVANVVDGLFAIARALHRLADIADTPPAAASPTTHYNGAG